MLTHTVDEVNDTLVGPYDRGRLKNAYHLNTGAVKAALPETSVCFGLVGVVLVGVGGDTLGELFLPTQMWFGGVFCSIPLLQYGQVESMYSLAASLVN
jgi:hypothetical protein